MLSDSSSLAKYVYTHNNDDKSNAEKKKHNIKAKQKKNIKNTFEKVSLEEVFEYDEVKIFGSGLMARNVFYTPHNNLKK